MCSRYTSHGWGLVKITVCTQHGLVLCLIRLLLLRHKTRGATEPSQSSRQGCMRFCHGDAPSSAQGLLLAGIGAASNAAFGLFCPLNWVFPEHFQPGSDHGCYFGDCSQMTVQSWHQVEENTVRVLPDASLVHAHPSLATAWRGPGLASLGDPTGATPVRFEDGALHNFLPSFWVAVAKLPSNPPPPPPAAVPQLTFPGKKGQAALRSPAQALDSDRREFPPLILPLEPQQAHLSTGNTVPTAAA